MSDHNPCHGCTDRRPGTKTTPPCQTDCPRRAAWLAEHAAERAQRDKERILDGYAYRSRAQHSAIVMQDAKRRRERTRR